MSSREVIDQAVRTAYDIIVDGMRYSPTIFPASEILTKMKSYAKYYPDDNNIQWFVNVSEDDEESFQHAWKLFISVI